MTFTWSKTRAFIASALLVLVTNAIALGGVAYNRSGEPQSTLKLTERELPISRRDWLDNDNSAIDLDVRWRVRLRSTAPGAPYSYSSWSRELHWLSDAQKTQLGFAAPEFAPASNLTTRTWDPPARQAFVVLENDGPAYRLAVEQARNRLVRETELAAANPGVKEFEQRLVSARKELAREESLASRLFVIDVDLDADALRARYPDRSRYAVVRARLDARLEGEPHSLRSAVYVERLDIETISVPHTFRAMVEPLLPPDQSYSYEQREPRFVATVQWGRRLEPWIAELRRE